VAERYAIIRGPSETVSKQGVHSSKDTCPALYPKGV
jgi:hypothetical protein